MKFHIIDGIGPFFNGYKSETINWSKIPFRHLEKDRENLDPEKLKRIKKDFEIFCQKASKIGYDSITLDDMAHLVDRSFYKLKLRKKIQQYKTFYQELFQICKKYQLKIFITTDVIFSNSRIRQKVGSNFQKKCTFFTEVLERLFLENPEINGIIFRIGETDGLDVKDDFRSQITIQTTTQANQFLQKIIPILETHNKYGILRTWSVGVHQVGDLIWNNRTFHQVFQNITSPNLIVSLKYGESDFYRYSKISPLIFQNNVPKIIEFQARREREGFGAIPYFVGDEYEKYWKKIRKAPNLQGISVWCQTGGWSKHAHRTFLDQSSPYNELNTIFLIEHIKKNRSTKRILEDFTNCPHKAQFIQKFSEIFSAILYLEGFSDKSFYFRRLRIPPLLWKNWDKVSITPLFVKLHKFFGARPPKVRTKDIRELEEIGKQANLKNLNFYIETLTVLLACSRVLTGQKNSELLTLIKEYHARHPQGYEFQIDEKNLHVDLNPIEKILFKIFIREKSNYRTIDHILLTKLLSTIQYQLIRVIHKKSLPEFVDKQAMPLQEIFR